MINSHSLIFRINANIFYYLICYIYLKIFRFDILFNSLACEIFNIEIIIIYIKNFFLRNKIVRNINCEIMM